MEKPCLIKTREAETKREHIGNNASTQAIHINISENYMPQRKSKLKRHVVAKVMLKILSSLFTYSCGVEGEAQHLYEGDTQRTHCVFWGLNPC